MATHLIGLLLGLEDDWPSAFEALVRRAVSSVNFRGETHTFETERVTIEPFNLRDTPRHALVIDRLAWWYFMPREWLKKVAMMDEVYLLNNPFTFQSMEKHTAYCAMMRLGLNIPETWLLPHKIGPNNERWQGTAQRYNKLFNLEEIASKLGYPLYMKPFDGGGWRGVTRIDNVGDLHRAYDASGQSLMHLQAGIQNFDHFLRSLSIGPMTRVMKYLPDKPQHERYATDLADVSTDVANQVAATNRLINAFFRWEFNSCEVILKDGVLSPIDYANACPDVALTSLHVHFPWAITSLVKWCVFCAATGREMRITMDARNYFEIADAVAGDAKTQASAVAAYAELVNEYFETARFEEFCAAHLAHVDDAAYEYFTSGEFDDLLVRTVIATFQPHEHDHYVWHYRQLMKQWAAKPVMA